MFFICLVSGLLIFCRFCSCLFSSLFLLVFGLLLLVMCCGLLPRLVLWLVFGLVVLILFIFVRMLRLIGVLVFVCFWFGLVFWLFCGYCWGCMW